MEHLIFHTDHLFLENNVKTMKSYPEENILKKKIYRKKVNMQEKRKYAGKRKYAEKKKICRKFRRQV
jgi:hypothetical protein